MPLIDALRAGVDLANAQRQGLITAAQARYALPNEAAKLYELQTNNKYLDEKNRLANQGTGLANIHSGQVNQTYIPNILSEIARRNASTQGQGIANLYDPERLRLANEHQAQVNKQYPALTQAEIENYKATANFKNSGGGKGGVGNADINALIRQTMSDNPALKDNPLQANKIVSAWLAGEKQVDGESIPEPSGLSRAMLNQITKRGSGTATINKAVQAKQADAELQVLNKYATEGLAPYGNTVLGKSPQQIADTFKTDDESQIRLGKFMGSQALQYETAQIRNRIAQGEAGITATHELMGKSGQIVDAKFPFLSQKARAEAVRYIDEALENGLHARQSVDIGAYGATPASLKTSSKTSNKEDFGAMSDSELQKIINGGS